MRVLLQRVSHADVVVDGEMVGRIGPGLLALVGVTHNDSVADVRLVVDKMVGLRVFRDEEGRMNRSVSDVSGSVLVVSQFTLYGDARRGRRPSFTDAAAPEHAEPLVREVIEGIAAAGIDVASGSFGAMMEVSLLNDGPVTLLLETDSGRFV